MTYTRLKDHLHTVKMEAGELITAKTDPEDVWGVGELVDLDHSGHWSTNKEKLQSYRASQGDITIFKSVGVGIQDVAIARAIVDKARQQGLGTAIEGFHA